MTENQEWVLFTKRTEDPKLRYIESLLDEHEIPHRRNGESWHGPITEVPQDRLAEAWDLLNTTIDFDDDGNPIRLDDIPDDDTIFDEWKECF
jgi:hypothetical protein